MPNRILKESICSSDTINDLAWEEEAFFYRLLTACDDYGRFDARPSVIRGKCFPLRLDSITDAMVEGWLKRLQEMDLIQLYEVDSKRYVQITTWTDHQQVRAKASKFPQPPASAGNSKSLQASDIKCNQPSSPEIIGKHMSPYSYPYPESESYSRSGCGDGTDEPPTTSTAMDKLQRLKPWLQQNCDKALSDMNLESRWGRFLWEGFEVETIQLAIEDAALHGAAATPIYIFRILDRWLTAKAFTPDAARALLDAHEKQRDADTPARRPAPQPATSQPYMEGLDLSHVKVGGQ